MKKLLLLLIIIITLVNCNKTDETLKIIIKNEIDHINKYNYIQKNSKDTIIIKYIDSLKIKFKEEAFETKGFLESKEGILYGHFPETLNLIDDYIYKLK